MTKFSSPSSAVDHEVKPEPGSLVTEVLSKLESSPPAPDAKARSFAKNIIDSAGVTQELAALNSDLADGEAETIDATGEVTEGRMGSMAKVVALLAPIMMDAQTAVAQAQASGGAEESSADKWGFRGVVAMIVVALFLFVPNLIRSIRGKPLK